MNICVSAFFARKQILFSLLFLVHEMPKRNRLKQTALKQEKVKVDKKLPIFLLRLVQISGRYSYMKRSTP